MAEVSERAVLALAERASTLTERLGQATAPLTDEDDPTLVQRRLEQWCQVVAKGDWDAFRKRLEQYQKIKKTNPDVLAAIWWDEMGRVWAGFRGRGRVELLDSHLGPDGLDLTTVVPPPKR